MTRFFAKDPYPSICRSGTHERLRSLCFLFCALMMFHSNRLYSQTTGPARSGQFTFSGYLRDAVNGETLLNATISISPGGIATQTNAYGFFSIALAPGKYKVSFSYTGYTLLQQDIDISKDLSLNVSLLSTAAQLQEVTITAEKKLRRTNTVALGIQQMDMSRIKKKIGR